MSITFYYAPMSTSSITEAVLAELELDYQGVELDIDAGDTQSQSFLKINPNARVPVIIHDGVTIWESAAITLYLGETFGVEKALFPALGPSRGEAMKWVVWSNLNLADAAGKLAAQLSPEAPGAVQKGSQDFVAVELRRPEALVKAKADMHRCFAILNAALAQRRFLLNQYSIVDTHLFVLVAWALFMEWDLSAFPHVDAWFARCIARPVLGAMMSDDQ
ncbi:glutathione S-transferase family protein [uncultured Paraglaciecola sp.]|uniref:glutathione S-transferase family protein n=1 Tax=uncultured Paraglaciecola sp. TaxID=1765024 RepID=UPI0030DCBA91|tara:strand:- start:16920 stop:17576 length:657 start_codon:yes stop_codon:yes gene_type:complete